MTKAWLMAAAGTALTALCVGLLAPAQSADAATFVPISGAGSTWSFNAFHQWIADVAQFGMPVNYADVGSTAGRADFAQGTFDWAASDVPYGVQDGASFDPPPARGFAYMPDTAGGVALVYNLSIGGLRVTNLRLSGAVIAGIFTDKITRWNDPAIAADNPGLTLPSELIIPVVRTDPSGATWAFTQWMAATQGPSWTAYCQTVGRSPCTATTAYPVLPGSQMIGQAGDLGVTGYVSQPQADGSIGLVEDSLALESGLEVAKVLNAAGYYTAPTPGNVGMSLLKAQIDTNVNDPLDGSADLSQVYTDTDPRTYELSYYSYMILPTDTSFGLSTDKGFTLGAFGQFLLCQGQQQVDQFGYAALPINLVEDGYAQLQKVPGASLPATAAAFIAGCANPTFATDGTNTLPDTVPMPPACDQQGATQCPPALLSILMSLTASPDPATAGQPVTLTAMESAQDGSRPAGSVQFEAGGTAIGSAVAVDATGTATTTTTFAAAGTVSLSAVFTPALSGVTGTTSVLSLTVTSPGGGGASGTEPLAVSLPASGTFALTVGTGTVALTVSGSSATGALSPVTVSDTRNTYPGWSVSGQTSDFTGSGSASGGTIPGNQLGWAPTDTSLGTGVTLGGAVTPAAPGLGSAPAVLAQAHSGTGFGISALGANLTLVIPALSSPGPYTATLTITAVTSLV